MLWVTSNVITGRLSPGWRSGRAGGGQGIVERRQRFVENEEIRIDANARASATRRASERQFARKMAAMCVQFQNREQRGKLCFIRSGAASRTFASTDRQGSSRGS